METIYFQPKGINPQYCEAGMIHESDPEHIWYLDEPCKILISEVEIIPKENVSYDKKSRSYIVIKMEIERQKVTDTGGIPQCPYCKKPTKRTGGVESVTCMYYPPVYDEQGNNTNPDRNTRTSGWECLECKKHYTTAGNYTDGFYYGALAGV